MANIRDFPQAPPDTRWSSQVRDAWGNPPPHNIERKPFEFWDGTPIPGGVNQLIAEACARLDQVFRIHRYSLAESADDWCWSRRKIKGASQWSLHSWAIALDINATINVFSKKLVTDFTPQVIADVQAIKHLGRTVWAWGGQWGRGDSNFDPMHFQINLTPNEAASMRPQILPAAPPDALALEERLAAVERTAALARVLVAGSDPTDLAQLVARGLRNGGEPDPLEVGTIANRIREGESPQDLLDEFRQSRFFQ